MEKSIKRLSLVLIAALFFCVGLFFVACDDGKENEKPDPQPSAEQGDYYYAASATEDYSLSLVLGNTFTLSIAGENLEGSYTITGEQVTLTAGSATYSATYYNDAVTLTYKNASYRFLRKTLYTVSYNTAGGSSVKDASVMNGKTAAKPEDPTLTGSTFVGWYTDSAFKTLFSFTQPITSNITLYARFVQNIDPEFEVNFNASHVGAAEIPAQKTVGHKLYTLPTPEWEGHTFLGWWYSSYGDSNRLTAKYEDQTIEEPMTFYAVWESDRDLAVSVTASGVKWQGRTGNNNYTVLVTGPQNSVIVNSASTASSSYDVDFSELPAGDYTVKVTLNGATSTAYYRNKALARVTDFKVEGSKLLFNSVSNATNYFITVSCGTAEHMQNHTHEAQDLGAETSFDFTACDMMSEGIIFTVEAKGEGYLSSESKAFAYKRELAPVAALNFDTAKDTVSWEPVEHAASYNVSVLLNGQEVLDQNVGTATSLDLQYYNKGEVSVSVTPVAFGWISPAATQKSYTKAHLATPQNLRLEDATTIVWDPVADATGYTVVFDGTTYTVNNDNKLDLAGKYSASKSSFALTVQATAGSVQSLATPEFTIRSGAMGDVVYEAGYVKWDAVFGYASFLVKVGDADPVTVTNATSYKPTFTAKGDTTISVAVSTDGEPAWKSVSVTVYMVQFDSDGGDGAFEPFYFVQGDPLGELPQPSYFGYSFGGWYYEKEGAGRPFEGPTFEDSYDPTVYAKWDPNEYTVHLDYGTYSSDEIVGEETVLFGSNYKLPAPESNDPMYAFAGWFSTSSAYTNYLGNSLKEFLDSGDVYLTAKWVPVLKFEEDTDGWIAGPGEGINYVKSVKIPYIWNEHRIDQVGDFQGCNNLESIYIPDTIKRIVLGPDGLAFQNCAALTNIEIYQAAGEPSGSQVYYSVDGVLFYWNDTDDRMELKLYPYARQDGEYTIPDVIENVAGKNSDARVDAPVDVIAAGAFHAYKYSSCPLQTLNIPASVRLIEAGAFYNFYDLSTLNFLPAKNGVEASSLDIRPQAFGDAKEDSLSVSRIKSVHLPKRPLVTSPRDAFKGLTYFAYIDVESGGTFSSVDGLLVQKNETYNGNELVYYPANRHVDENGKAYVPDNFSTSGRATEFVVPRDIVSIGEGAVRNVTGLNRIVITEQVRYIGKSAFEGTTGLKELIFEGTELSVDLTIDERAFLGERWDLDNPSAKSPEGTTNGLKTLTLPANLVKLGAHAFGSMTGSSNLNEVTVNAARETVEYAIGAFDGTLPGTIYGSSKLGILNLGPKVPALEVTDIFGSALKKVNVDKANQNYTTDDQGIVFDGAQTKLVFFPSDWDKDYTIPATITNIASGMFNGRTGLTGITLHKGVTRIGDEAFKGCTGLKFVEFAENEANAEKGTEPLEVGNSAFEGCKLLTTVELPARTKSIGSKAFAACSALEEFTVPKDCELLATYEFYQDCLYVFDDCLLLNEIKVAEGNTHFISIEGVLYTARPVLLDPNKNEISYVADQLLFCPKSKTGTVTVPGTIRSAATYAIGGFNDNDGDRPLVDKIIFEDAVPTYDPETKELESMDITFDVGAEDRDAGTLFAPFTNLSKLTEIHLPEGLVSLPAYLFNGCDALRKINIPSTVTFISKNALYGISTLTELTFDPTPAGADGKKVEKPLEIEDGTSASGAPGTVSRGGAFAGLSLTTLVLPARLSKLGSYAFAKNTLLSSVTFEATEVKSGFVIGTGAFNGCSSITKINLPKGLAEIGASAFSATGLTSLNLPDSLTTIGASAFSGIKTLKGTLNIPKSVKTIGDSAFTGTGFSAIVFADDSEITSIGNGTFSSMADLESVTFGKDGVNAFELGGTPSTVNAGATGAFQGDMKLTSIVLPLNLKRIGENTFASLRNLKSITWQEKAGQKSKLETIERWAFQKSGLTSFTFPETEKPITFVNSKNDATAQIFKGCVSLETVHLSSTVSTVANVFTGCTVGSVTVAANSPYFRADENGLPVIYDKDSGSIVLFYDECDSIFAIPDGSKTIAGGAFAGQTALEAVTIPASVQKIEAKAFQNCINLKTVTIANGSVLETIEQGAFYNCLKLESINLEAATHLATLGDGNDSLSKEEKGIFENAGLKSENPFKVKFPASPNLTVLGKYIFRGSGVKEVDMSAATALESFSAGYSSDTVGEFSKSLLESIKLPPNLKYIGSYTFCNCEHLTKVDFGTNTVLEHMGAKANQKPSYAGNDSSYVFQNCTALASITLPSSLKSLGGYSFFGCTALKTVKGLENVTLIGYYAFSKSGLEAFALPLENTNMVQMGTYVFANCTELKTVDFSNAKIAYGSSSSTTYDNSIPNSMFLNCTALTDVRLPQSLVHIGTNAFQGCTELQEIDLSACTGMDRFSSNPTSNVSVNGTAKHSTFQGCTSLKTVKLPDTITQIGVDVFQGCTSLESFTFPASLTTVGKEAFMDSGLKNLTLPANVKSWGDNVFKNIKITSITFPANFAGALPKYTFSAVETLKTVNFEGALTGTLPDYMFQNCTGLTSVDLSKTGLASLPNYMFTGCSNLSSVTLPDGITKIGNNVFEKTAIKKMDLAKYMSLTSIGSSAFSGCAQLNEVTFPGMINSIGSSAFQNCTSLTKIDLSLCPVLTKLAGSMFSGCTSLSDIKLPPTKLTTTGSTTFKGTAIKTMDLSNLTEKYLQSYLFQDCSQLESVILPSTLTYIGSYAFQNCTSLRSIDISNTSITNLSTSATNDGSKTAYTFDGCTNLQEVITNPGQIKVVAQYVFRNCENLKSFDFSGVTDIGAYSFQNSGLEGKVTLSKDLANLRVASNYYPFTGCTKITEFAFDGENAKFTAVNGALVGSDGTLYALPGGAEVVDGTLDFTAYQGASALKLTAHLFDKFTNVKKVILPDGMEEIPAYTFQGSSVEEVVLPASLKTIGNYAFQGSALKTIDLKNVETIGNYAFEATKALAEITIPASVTSLGTAAFAHTEGLKTVTFLDPADGEEAKELTFAAGATSPTSSTVGVFRGSSVETVTLPGRLKTIAAGAFHETKLTTVKFNEGIETLGAAVFANVEGLKSITFPDSLKEIGNYCFAYCTFTEVDFNKVTKIGNYAFEYTKITALDTKNVETIGNDVFEYSDLASVTIRPALTSLGSYTFARTKLEEITVPGTVETIGYGFACFNESLIRATVEDSAEGLERSISGNQFFKECPNLLEAYLGEGITNLNSATFLNCTSLTKVHLPGTMTNIGSQAFLNCTSLMKVVIPENIAQISESGITSIGDQRPFGNWTAEQQICFRGSRYATCALVGVNWMSQTDATLVFDYEGEE